MNVEKVYCKNTVKKKCKSVTYTYSDGITPKRTTPHSKQCLIFQKRNELKNGENRKELDQSDNFDDQESQIKDKEIEENKSGEHDFKVIYRDNDVKKKLEETNPNFDFLKEQEDHLKLIIKKKEVKISDFIKRQSIMEDYGMKIIIPELIRRVTGKEERSLMLNIYKEELGQLEDNQIDWTNKQKNVGFFEWNTLIGVATFKALYCNGKKIIQILLLSVKQSKRLKEIGTKIISHLKEMSKVIVVNCDNGDSVDFYTELKFSLSPRSYLEFNTLETYEKPERGRYFKFMIFGEDYLLKEDDEEEGSEFDDL